MFALAYASYAALCGVQVLWAVAAELPLLAVQAIPCRLSWRTVDAPRAGAYKSALKDPVKLFICEFFEGGVWKAFELANYAKHFYLYPVVVKWAVPFFSLPLAIFNLPKYSAESQRMGLGRHGILSACF